jgi:RNA ligase
MKLWYDDSGWRLSTNGTIDARNAELQSRVSVLDYYKKLENYHDLFMYAVKDLNWERVLNSLDKTMTYMFELVSPYNRIVVPYTETKLYHIGTRSNVDLLEWEYDIAGIEQPTVYDMGTLEECLVSAESLPFSEEGYVIVDSKYNRVKIKSAEYVMAHHLRGNAVTYKRIVEMILSNVSDDFLSIYPEFQPSFDEVWDAIWEYIANLMKESISVPEVKTRKDFAQWALTTSNAGYFFGWLDKKWNDPKQWMWGLTAEKVLEYLELEQ